MVLWRRDFHWAEDLISEQYLWETTDLNECKHVVTATLLLLLKPVLDAISFITLVVKYKTVGKIDTAPENRK